METEIQTEDKTDLLKNKKMPPQYRGVIIEALSHYPELSDTAIEFVLKKKHPVPYSTLPSLSGLLVPGAPRKYIITIQEEAHEPVRQALFKNLPRESQLAVIGHELGHVLQYNSLSTTELIKLLRVFVNIGKKRQLERGADVQVIEHGLGRELYAHSLYIRNIKGYLEKRKEIDLYYLKPHEILDGLCEKETGIGV